MKKRKSKRSFIIMKVCLLFIIGSIVGYLALFHISQSDIEEFTADGLSIDYQFLTPNPYSRGQQPLKKIKGIVVHYTANPSSNAQNNRDYFESQKIKKQVSVSSHFIVGLKGEIIQCIPLNEISYASNNRNKDTISIETCHPDKSGQFNDKTYKSLLTLVRALVKTYNLSKEDIIRHYDVTGKICPKYFVDNPKEWQKFLDQI